MSCYWATAPWGPSTASWQRWLLLIEHALTCNKLEEKKAKKGAAYQLYCHTD